MIIIGYSLPEADSAACLLLGTSGISDKRLTLVNPDANNLRDRYRSVTGNTQIVSYAGLDEFLNREKRELGGDYKIKEATMTKKRTKTVLPGTSSHGKKAARKKGRSRARPKGTSTNGR